MTELCSKVVSEWTFFFRIADQLRNGRRFSLVILEELLMGMIFTSLRWSISLRYHVGRPTCDELFASSSRDELEAEPMSWKLEAFLWLAARLILDGVLAPMTGKHILQYFDILLESIRKIFGLVAFIVQSLLNFVFFFCTNRIAELWNTLGGYKIRVLNTKAFYTYKKLQNRHIRLLRLHRDRFFRIRYELVEVPLHDAPCFEAISYTWGDQLAVEHITISDKTFRTTQTVARILRSRCHKLRLIPVPGIEFFVWIDALCINQEDRDEKNHQIPLMREIYSCAIRVVVCLGNGSYDRKAAWLLLELFYISPALSPEKMVHEYLQERDPSSWFALSELLAHPWFTRIWVVQEVAVARDVLLIYGHGILSWDVVHWTMRLLLSRSRSTVTPTLDSNFRSDLPIFFKTQLINCARRLTYIKKSWTLSEAMIKFSEYKATDPRDKVFAILGLVTDDLDMKEWIDYYKTPEQVYTKTARYILSRKEDGLALLALAGIGYVRKLNGLPSWVPDWSKPRSGLAFNLFSVTYNASGGRECDGEILLDPDLNIIRLVGAKADTVRAVGKAGIGGKYFKDDSICLHQRLFLWYQECCNLEENRTSDPYLTLQPREEAFWRALIGDRTTESRPAPAIFSSYFRSIQKMFLNPSFHENCHTALSMDCDFCKLGSNFFASHEVLEFCNALSPISSGRRFCVTERGYMGWVPPHTVSGDLVCILYGARTPFLLRNEIFEGGKHGYRLVGECFFHGMMDGEMLTASHRVEDFIVY